MRKYPLWQKITVFLILATLAYASLYYLYLRKLEPKVPDFTATNQAK